MAVIRKVTRVSNPRKRYRRSKSIRNAKGRFVKTKSNPRKRRHTRKRNTSAKTKAPVIHRYAVKALKKELKRRGVKLSSNGGTKRRYKRHARRKRNPVLIELASLGSMVNPKRRKNVAKTRKRRATRRKTRNPRRHAVAKVTRRRRRRYTRRRATNPVARVTRRRRRRSAVGVVRRTRRRRMTNGRRRHYSRRRNPAFGIGGKDLLTMVGGGLIGVAATKYLPTLLPSSITSGLGGGALMSVAISGAGAFAAGWLARKFVGEAFGKAVFFGGLMQAGSALLNAIAPASISSKLALSGVGDIVPGWYAVPQNPITSRAPMAIAAAGSGTGMGNLRRFGTFR